MKRREIIKLSVTVTILIAISIFAFNYIYSHYYKIDITPYSYSFLARISDSPNKQHSVMLTIYRTEKTSDITYIMGTLCRIDENNVYSKDSKTIFWQRVNTESIGSKLVDNVILTDWIDLEWIDNSTVDINNISLGIDSVYDYRRN